jgi:hypothetical protein
MGPADSMVVLITALALLGLGWNSGLISGIVILVDVTPTSTRAKTQGSVDVLFVRNIKRRLIWNGCSTF